VGGGSPSAKLVAAWAAAAVCGGELPECGASVAVMVVAVVADSVAVMVAAG